MALTQRLDLRQTQSLVMTPQLQQAIKLLQLSNLELTAYVDNELERNPLLERDEGERDEIRASGVDAEAPAASQPNGEAVLDSADLTAQATMPAERDQPLDSDDSNLWSSAGASDSWDGEDGAGAWKSTAGGRGDFEDGDRDAESTLTRGDTLRDHLISQLGLDIEDPVDRVIGMHLIDQVDDAGYLTGDLGAIAQLMGCDVARVEATLRRLQRFDPPGIFARSLAECLALQLADRNRLDPAIKTVLDNLPLLASRDHGQLMKLAGIDAEDLADIIAEIRSLNPKPGEGFETMAAQPVIPDILMRARPGGEWSVELNSDTLPRVLVNQRYYSEVSRTVRKKAEKEYLTERLQSANWLVKSLHQRATTILKVATEIVRQQDGFFRHGVQHLKPLILRDIAEAIGMHESTVSRVTTNKFMASPRGIYELKYFFTSAIASTAGGVAHSAEAVRHRIKDLVEKEAATAILSDDDLVEALHKDGVDIARRTVAKYRESLKIPSSVQRRREKSRPI
ncbi:MAG: RNA polymerase factor sigma-54 [Alphaproteobacteria bacterium]|nr:RNA polymerase factor sigma-54 [Alphaproteobacteria bacterium]